MALLFDGYLPTNDGGRALLFHIFILPDIVNIINCTCMNSMSVFIGLSLLFDLMFFLFQGQLGLLVPGCLQSIKLTQTLTTCQRLIHGKQGK